MADNAEDFETVEDLVLRNSPLDQYLREIGVNNFTSYSSQANDDTPQEISHEDLVSPTDVPTRPGKKHHSTKSPFYGSSTNLIPKFMSAVTVFMFPTLSYSSKASLKEIMSLFVNSDILIDVDKNQICLTMDNGSFCDNSEFARHREQYDKKEANFVGRKSAIASMFMLFVSISMAAVSKLQIYQSVAILGALFLVFLAVAGLFVVIYQFFMQQKMRKACKKTVQLTKDFIKNFETVCKTLDKSFLLIRECEVISQGFTFYHPSIPALQSQSRKRGSCLILREAIMESCLRLFEITSVTTKLLIEYLPKDLYLTYAEDGIFNIALEDLKTSIAEIGLKGNGIPPTDLIKSVICLIKSGLIELFQVILLLATRQATVDDNLGDDFRRYQGLLCTLTGIYESNMSTVSDILNDIQSKYSFVKENEFRETVPQNKPAFGYQPSQIQLSIDSAFLHLKSAMGHLEYLQGILPHGSEAGDYLNINSVPQEEIHKLVCIFGHDLESAKDCMADIDNFFALKAGRMSVDEPLVLSKAEAPERLLDPSFQYTELSTQEGDLLLEGVSEPSPAQNEAVQAEQSFLEDQRFREQLNENKRLIKELEVIFAFKKSPIGLVPMDLVKESMTSARTLGEDSYDDAGEKFVSLNEMKKNVSLNLAAAYEGETSFHITADKSTILEGNESTLTRTGIPPVSLMDDLKHALMNRPQQDLLKENMIEAFTCTSDVSDSEASES